MPQLSLDRVGGILAASGGALWFLRVAVDGLGGPSNLAGQLLFILPLLFGAGVFGFYTRYTEEMRGEGKGGFVQTFVGLGFLAVGFFLDLTLGMEQGIRISTFGFIILTIGLVLLGFATLKTEPMYVGNFLPLAIGMLTLFNIIAGGYDLARVAISAIFGLGWIAWGIILFLDSRPPRHPVK